MPLDEQIRLVASGGTVGLARLFADGNGDGGVSRHDSLGVSIVPAGAARGCPPLIFTSL